VFPGEGWSLVWPLAVGTASFVMVAVLCGALYGLSRWVSLALMMITDALLRLIAIAVVCAMVSYALMNLVMTSAPLAIVGCGFATGRAADVEAGPRAAARAAGGPGGAGEAAGRPGEVGVRRRAARLVGGQGAAAGAHAHEAPVDATAGQLLLRFRLPNTASRQDLQRGGPGVDLRGLPPARPTACTGSSVSAT